jgi:hypothetical protein
MSYTEEQSRYINYDKKTHTKLLACAGSGKTRCIIARIHKLIENDFYKYNEIMMLTFSRLTRDDFIGKIESYGLFADPLKVIGQVNTIDSFAKRIVDRDDTVDVSLLSYKLMKYLESEDPMELAKNMELAKIKTVFIDEAQDLNEIQYLIFCHMRDKLGIIINMVGDPNQNIFQFRKSSDKYLKEFVAEEFKLTNNFRSHESVVNFSNFLRPFEENDVVCQKGSNGCEPLMMFYEDENILEMNILDILEEAKKRGIDMSKFAILAPTRGRMRGGGRSHGLCFVSNILYKAGFKFKQFYEESVDEANGAGIKYAPTPDHVNILTYMGSKGLEWDYVIIIDANACLINKRQFNEEKHRSDQYLLYVACSRAVQNMYIFSKCFFKDGAPHFNTNPWFNKVPDVFYQIDDRYAKTFYYSKPKYIDTMEKNNKLSKIIDNLDCFDLDCLSNLIGYQTRKIKHQKSIFKNDYSLIEKPSAIFLSKYTECLFRALYEIKHNIPHTPFTDIENVIDSDHVVTNLPEEVSIWYYKNKKNMTWEKFDTDDLIPELIKKMINQSFDRKKKFNAHHISPNGYYQWFILDQKIRIKNLYTKYLKCKNSSQIREILFHLMVVLHGIDTQHYFHIKSKGQKYKNILDDFKNLFDDMEEYVDDMDHRFDTIDQNVTKWGIFSKIDMIDSYDQIWSIRCTNDISLKHTLHSIIGSMLYHHHPVFQSHPDLDPDILDFDPGSDDLVEIDVNYINLLKGEEITYQFDLTQLIIKKIIHIITKNI